MKSKTPEDLSKLSMEELFRVETENQTAVLNSGLLELERAPADAKQLEVLMRAAHSLKGAASIVHLSAAVKVAHALEDCFVAAQHGKVQISRAQTDVLLRGVDLLQGIAGLAGEHVEANEAQIGRWLVDIERSIAGDHSTTSQTSLTEQSTETALVDEQSERVLRLTAENLNRLLALAGESLVESRWLHPFSDSFQRLKRLQDDVGQSLGALRDSLDHKTLSEQTKLHLNELVQRLNECRDFLGDRLNDLDSYERRTAHLSQRLYLEVLRARMMPFGDGTASFPRMVRDLARSFGKEVKFEIVGETTQVDRDILERLKAPLTHLLRNAVDHGCETPEIRKLADKNPEANIRLEARHSAGTLLVIVSDDGAGVDPELVRQAVIERKLAPAAVAEKLGESELLEFLFLPGFTLKKTVTEISGRGVGLDIVQNMVKSVRGTIRAATQPGRGTRFQLQLPITLSVLRTLLVEIAGEPYAFPLAQISQTLKLPRDKIEVLEGRHHFQFGNERVGLLTAHQVLGCGSMKPPRAELPVVVLGDRDARYGLIVDRLLGERELVVQPLDPRLGKVQDVSAAALMEDGSSVLILDVDDMVRSIGKLVSEGWLSSVQRSALNLTSKRQKKILAVDDSLTVRELERKLLTRHGYQADVAVDGMDGWNAIRNGEYDLIITDVDMPRMDGIELTTLIKHDAQLKSLPVMIVSYKDRHEDKLRGMDAGADYYLTKGSFDDATLIEAVIDLIGEPDEH